MLFRPLREVSDAAISRTELLITAEFSFKRQDGIGFCKQPSVLNCFIVFIRCTCDCVAFNQCADVAVDVYTFKIKSEHFMELIHDSAALLPRRFYGSVQHGI